MFEFLKRKKKNKTVEHAQQAEPCKTQDQPETVKNIKNNESIKPENTEHFTNIAKEKTQEEKAIEMIKNSSLKKYYDLMETTFKGKNVRDIFNGINNEISHIFYETGIKIDECESVDKKLEYAKRAFDYVAKNIEYDRVLTQFMRIASDKIYHENINNEIMKEVYYGLCNHAGTCLSDACTISYMFEKIGLDSTVIGLGDHAMVEVNINGKKLYCDSTYEQGILNGTDKIAISQGKGYGAGFMQDEKLLIDRNYHKEFELPKISLVFKANVYKDESDDNDRFSYTFDK